MYSDCHSCKMLEQRDVLPRCKFAIACFDHFLALVPPAWAEWPHWERVVLALMAENIDITFD